MDKTEKRICIYGSALIALVLSSPKLLALRENGIIAQFWHFNPVELGFQTIFNFVFCYVLFYMNLAPDKIFSVHRDKKRWKQFWLLNVLLVYGFVAFGTLTEYFFFYDPHPGRIYLGSYQLRFGISSVLIAILIKIILLLRDAKLKEQENERLRSAYMTAELELLKEQLNPHFLFNSLSSLSGVVRENPTLAQHYIKHLSKVFRYALVKSENSMVTLEEELSMLKSFAELLTMRFEDAFKLVINIDKKYMDLKIPHLSLQPLLENAAKHNSATLAKPLTVEIFTEDDTLVVRNNLQQIAAPENSTGLGLANLTDRFRILMHSQVEITKTPEYFSVKLPLNK